MPCVWSSWGDWAPCSVTCGKVGEGVRSRLRHMAVKPAHGGAACVGSDNEVDRCVHQKDKDGHKDKGGHKDKDGHKVGGIPFCPGVQMICDE